jgi:hypothetical protein
MIEDWGLGISDGLVVGVVITIAPCPRSIPHHRERLMEKAAPNR